MEQYVIDPPVNLWYGVKHGTMNKWKVNYQGSVATVADLPEEGEFKGDTYNILEDGSNYMWNGTSWDKLDSNVYVGATSSSSGIQGLVPSATAAQTYSILTGMGTWQSARDLGLALDNEVLHKTGVETVTGEKIFSGIQTTALGNESALMVVKDPVLVKGETPESTHFLSLGFIDSTGNSYAQNAEARLGVFEYKSPSSSSLMSCVQMADMGFYEGATSAVIQVGHDADGIMFARAPATSNERTASTDIVTRGYLKASEWNWQKTLKAKSVTFVPVSESNLEPVVDFMFTETLPAEGEKGPENPSMITGVSTVTVTHCKTEGVESTDYTIQLGNSYYGGSIDVSTGLMTVTHRLLVFDGTEGIEQSAQYGFYYTTTKNPKIKTSTSFITTHYSTAGGSLIRMVSFTSTTGTTFGWSTDASASWATVAELQAWLAAQYANGTPLTLVYELLEPATIQLTPTQILSLTQSNKYEPKINTVYTDQEAVQVGYQRFYDENRLAAIEARLAALEGN